jgi:predicted nucleic acid-binding protein
VTVLDASALIAAMLGEAARDEVEAILRSKEDRPKVSAVNVAEVVDGLTRVAGRPLAQVEEAIDWLLAGGLVTVPVTEAIGRTAGELRAAHYHRVDAPLSPADCIALATSQSVADALATADRTLAATARQVGIQVIALPDSRGIRPS